MEQFAIIIQEKKTIGRLLQPYILQSTDTGRLDIVELITAEHLNNPAYQFSPIAQKVINLLVSISDKLLYKQFCKDKKKVNLRQFFDKADEKLVELHMRPYIDKKVTAALQLLVLENIPVYIKDPNYGYLYASDKADVKTTFDEAVFCFDLEESGLKYTLKILQGNSHMGLTNRDVNVLTATPASFLINNRLYRFESIDIKKFEPFMRVNHLFIGKQSLTKYMDAFVTKCVREQIVDAKGFDVIEKDIDVQPLLNLEKSLAQLMVLTLKYRYDQKEHYSGLKTSVFVELKQHNGRYVFYKMKRNFEVEASYQNYLLENGLKQCSESQYAVKDDPDDESKLYGTIEWLGEHKEALLEKGFLLQQEDLETNYFIGKVEVEFEVNEKVDWFDVRAILQIGSFKVPFGRLKYNIINRNKEYQLPDGSIFIIPSEWFSRYSELMQFNKSEGDDLVIDKMHAHLLEMNDDEKHLTEWQLRMKQLYDQEGIESLALPHQLNATLRPYQLKGFNWMQLLGENDFGGILADDMGLGKTLQTIALLTSVYKQDESAPPPQNTQLSLFDAPIKGFNTSNIGASLVVVPTSLLHNWSNEIRKFAPHLKVYQYAGNNRAKTKSIGNILRHYHVVITTYGLARNDIDYLKNYKFHYLICDESQNIKNPSSKLYAALHEIQSDKKLVLTGTPIENSLIDLWAQMNFVNKGLLGTLGFFKRHYVAPIERNKSEDKEQKLQDLIKPFILRRTKEMVAKELPPVTEQVLVCDMTEDQQSYYEKIKSGVRNELMQAIQNGGVQKNAIMALKALTKLRQIANHPAMVDSTYTGSSGKFEQIMENLENIISEKHKVLIFSSFVKDLELIEKELKTKKIIYSKLTGSTANRQDAVNQFTNNEDCRVFLISLKAGGVGLNLVEADYVFVLNPWWNPAAEAQAINRAHRIGQTKNVFVYKFISSESIEEKILKLQAQKLELANTFITNNNPLKDITEGELQELFA